MVGDRPHAVVTGGSGFLGSHIVDALLVDGYRVTSLDNYGSGRSRNLDHVDSPRLETRTHDIRETLPEFDSVDQIYHFASRASPDDFKSHAVEIALTNSVGARNALQCARAHDARLVLASTSEVYGNPEVHPQHEEYNGNVNVRGPRAPYDESKRFAEALAVAFDQQYDLDVRTVRIFNTYGPRMRPDDGRVVPNFVTRALRGDDLVVYGDGSQTRSFCYVTDLVRGIRRYAELSASDAAGSVVNLGSEDELTIRGLAETVIEVTGSESGVVFGDLPGDDPEVRRPDVSRARSMFDWEPTVDLREGIRRTADHFDR